MTAKNGTVAPQVGIKLNILDTKFFNSFSKTFNLVIHHLLILPQIDS